MERAVSTLVFFLLLAFAATAQAPQAFKYQAVVRNATGQVLANQNVGLKIDLIQFNTVYSETHAVTTNAFGLVNLNVGRGTAQFGQFNMVHWEQQPIFIQLSLDATGGSNYEIMGFSELLSVPYALYAANAAGSSSLPADAQTGDIVYYDGTTWQRLPAGAAGTLLTMGADGKPFWKLPPQLDSLLKVTMTNGDVIYVSPTDNSTGVIWGGYEIYDVFAVPNFQTVAAANSDFNGEAHTTAIVSQLGHHNGIPYAAKLCADLMAYGFDDWYLPAAGELHEIYLNLGPDGNSQITSGIYLSSSEHFFGATLAWVQLFATGFQYGYPKDALFQCRCIRR
jgi:hypothetical protein